MFRAKDLLEAACKVAIERAGQPVPSGESLPTLFKLAAGAKATDKMESDVGHRLSAVVAQLAALRNVAGAGLSSVSTGPVSQLRPGPASPCICSTTRRQWEPAMRPRDREDRRTPPHDGEPSLKPDE